MPDFAGVVVAAGRSTRLGDPVPKQYQVVAGRPVLEHSVRCLASRDAVDRVIVVLAAEEIDRRGPEIRRWTKVAGVVEGGARRMDSVWQGVEAAGEIPFLLVHDAARPLASPRLVDAVVEATRRQGAAVPTLAVPDTVKEIDEAGHVGRTLDRSRLRLAQTPQGARADWLRRALVRAQGEGSGFTDEAAALEWDGRRVAWVEGDPDNRKITTRKDLDEARRVLQGGAVELRVGTGFDVHRLGADRPLVLGGVTFGGEPGLIGHSDADVVLHAAMDAALGAVALGDIGTHFPPDDETWRDADSVALARSVAAMLAERGFTVVNLDLTVLAERPKIKGKSAEMRAIIAEAFGLDPSRVGLKATTLEKLGALGRAEGIACEAVALVRGPSGR